MTEKDKMLAGELHLPNDAELIADRKRAKLLFQKINRLDADNEREKHILFKELLGSHQKSFIIEPPFYCDYGYNIHLGKHVFINFNCCFLDSGKITIGNNTMIGPNVQFYSVNHPMDVKTRNSLLEFGRHITIGNDCWLGGGVVITPGVSLGDGVVVGAGAVVTKSFGDNVFIAGNPAKVVREIEQ